MGMAIALALSAGSAVAATASNDTGTITFHGMVSNTTCKVSLDQKIDQSGNDFDVTTTPYLLLILAPLLWVLPAPWARKIQPALTGCDTATVAKASAQFNSGQVLLLPKAACWFHLRTLKVQRKR